MHLHDLTGSDARMELFHVLQHAARDLSIGRCFYLSAGEIGPEGATLTRALTGLEPHGPFSRADLVILDRSNEMALQLPQVQWQRLQETFARLGIAADRVVVASQARIRGAGNEADMPFGWIAYHSWPVRLATHYAGLPADDLGYDALFDRPPHFLCLNKKLRPHRYVALAMLLRSDLRDALTFSNLGIDNLFSLTDIGRAIRRAFPDFTGLLDPDGAAPVLPETGALDEAPGNRPGNPAWPGLAFPLREMRRSHVEIVTESDFAANATRFTEKLLKPMAAHRPFLVFASARTLMLLREHGFRTFDGLIDESYDQIPEANRRMKYVLAEAQRLHRLLADPQARRAFLDGAREICAHNQSHLRQGFVARIDGTALRMLNAQMARPPLPGLPG